MALVFAFRASTAASANSSAYTAGPSYTPGANSLLVACVASPSNTTAPDRSFTGHDVSWTQALTVAVGSSDVMAVYVANAGATPTTAVVTAQWTAGRTGCSLAEYEVTGWDSTVAAILSAVVQIPSTTATSSSPSVTLSAATNSSNRPLAFLYHAVNEVKGPRANWNEGHDAGHNSPTRSLESQYRTDAFETTASATTATSGLWMMIALEIKASLAEFVPHMVKRMLLMGQG
jgi:hypothetical protein